MLVRSGNGTSPTLSRTLVIPDLFHTKLPSLKLAANAPEIGCLEYNRFLLGPGLFSRAFW